LTERFVKGVLGYRTLVKEEMTNYNVSKAKTEIWEPEDFSLETTTVWGFPDRGDWATHSGKYRGNWSPYIPRNVILRYSNENDVVLDQFVGSGKKGVRRRYKPNISAAWLTYILEMQETSIS